MTDSNSSVDSKSRKRLAIIGGGSSGLICLKYAQEMLPNWNIRCFEQSDNLLGCWGNPYPGFVSTSTKFTTQFTCFPIYSAGVSPNASQEKREFFRDGEYGEYLQAFADQFHLHQNICLQTRVDQMVRSTDLASWRLSLNGRLDGTIQSWYEDFDQVIICTGLAADPRRIESQIPQKMPTDLHSGPAIRQRRIVVVGGGESAVDLADRLSQPDYENEIFLSLRSGIRVSPRYHPIRGVPSDFLRNRLMLSIHKDLRNWIGQRFVRARIKHQSVFERIFPRRDEQSLEERLTKDAAAKRKYWDELLTQHAKDELFNIFHNKSDNFLNAVGEGRIQIVGPPVDQSYDTFREFGSDAIRSINPDLIVPSIGYRARLSEISQGTLQLTDFYLGCCHVKYPDLFLVGFARPVIGNIPTISEMQAEYVCRLISGDLERPKTLIEANRHPAAWQSHRVPAFPESDIYPVEMFPYCDQLAELLGRPLKQNRWKNFPAWCRQQLEPATTLHYVPSQRLPKAMRRHPIYLPVLLIAALLMIKPIDWIYRSYCRCREQAMTSGRTGKTEPKG